MAQYAVIDDTDPRLVYTGNWRILKDPVNPRSPHYNGTIHVTNDPTATVSYQFYGTNLNVFGTIDSPATKGYPNASFAVDPNAVAQIHLNQTGDLPKLVEPAIATTHLQLFSSGRLVTGTYNMTIVADGVSPNGTSFYFDFLTVLIPEGTSTNIERVIVDDNDKNQWRYGSGWKTDSRPGVYLYSSHLIYNIGVSVTLPFQGTSIVVYGAIAKSYNKSKSLGQFQVDEATAQTVKLSDIPDAVALNKGVQLRNQPIFSMSGLTLGPHTLSISIPADSENITRPDAQWTVDYAIFGPVPLSNKGQDSSSSPPPGAIAGGVVGGLVFLCVILVAFIFWKRRRRQPLKVIKAGEDFLREGPSPTPYQSEMAPSKVGLPGRIRSIHKPVQQQHRDPQSPITSGVGDSTLESGSVLFSPLSEEPTATGYRIPRREVDGGVRLATSTNGEEVEEVLPPSYARYG